LRRQAVSKPGASIVRQIGKDSQVALLSASTRDYLYVFSKDGRCSRIGVHEIPEEGGKKVSDLTGFTGRDAITAALALPRERNGDEADYLFLVTEQGMVKRVRTEDVQSNTGGEFTVMNVDDGDRLLWALRTQGGQEVILVSAQGQSIRFSEEEVRSMGLPAGGVGGMKLKPKDRIVYAGVVDPAGELLTVTRAGFAKRSPLADYSAQGRNGGGIVAHKVTDKTGEVAAALVLPPQSEGDWLVFVTARGVAKPMLTVEVPAMGRSVQGKAVVELSSQDAIAAAWRIEGVKGEKSEEEKEGSRRLMAETPSSPPSSQPLRVSNSKRSREERKTTGDEKVTDRAKAASAAQQPAAEKTPAPPSGGRKPKTTASAQPKDATAPLAFEFIEQVPEVKPSGEKTDKRKSKLTAVVSVPEAQAKATKKPKG
jgi:DNA gyrase subunit A